MNSFLLIPLILLTLLPYSQATSLSNGILQDLNGDAISITSDASNWVFSNLVCLVPDCPRISNFYDSSYGANQVVLGGPNILGPFQLSTLGQSFEREYLLGSNTYKVFAMRFQLWIFGQGVVNSNLDINSFVDFSLNGLDFNPTKITSASINSVGYYVFVDSSGNVQTDHANRYYGDVWAFVPFSGGNSAKFKLTSKVPVPSRAASFGINSIHIHLMDTTNHGDYNYPCDMGYYYSQPTCMKCHDFCATCSGTSYTECSVCIYPNYAYGNGTCFDSCPSTGPLAAQTSATANTCLYKCPGEFYWAYNDSCHATCDPPYIRTLGLNDVHYCESPCQSDEYLFPNGTCINSCPSPLVKEILSEDLKYCLDPCYSQAFLYPDSTCSNDCLLPLSNRVESGIKYCHTPCPDDSHYLYPNGTCAGCEAPWLKEEPNKIKFCKNPCDSNGIMKYLYPDSSCNSTCPAPLFEKIEPGVTYCWNPCMKSKTFLHEILQVCLPTCPYPSITKNEKYGKYCSYPCEDHDNYWNMIDKKCEAACEYPYQATESPLPKLCSSSLSEEEIKQAKKMAGAADSANSASSTGNLIWSLISSGDSTAGMMGPLAKMLQYIKFMDVMFPEKVQLMLLEQTKKANKKGFTQKMLGSALDKYPNYEITEKFKFYSIKSNFFANFWPSLFNLSVIFVVTLLVIFAESQTKNNPKINGVLKSLSDILRWNVFLVTFCGTIGDIVLYTALEFQTMKFENAEAVVSFILCLGMNVLVVLVVVKILDVNSAIRKSKKKTRNEEEHKKIIAQEFNSYKALFDCYKDYSFYQQIFLFVFIMRLVIFNASIGYFYKYPLFQAITSLVTNILMFAYLVIKRPMRKIITLLQQIVLELILLPFNVCVLALAIMDSQEILEIDRRKSIGNVIFYINVMIPVLSVVLMAAKFIAMGLDLYKTWKISKSKKPRKFTVEAFRPKDNLTQEKLRNQPMAFDSSPTKNFSTDSHCNTTQNFDLSDNSMMMSPEINVMGQSSTLESPAYPRIKHSRPHMNDNNFLTVNDQNLNRNLSKPYHQNAFPQYQVQAPDRAQTLMEPPQMENNRGKIQRRKNKIKKSGRSKFKMMS